MEDWPETVRLLREILDVQKEQLAEYKRITARSLELQESAVLRQQQLARLYRQVVVAGGILVVALMGLLGYLLIAFRYRLFR